MKKRLVAIVSISIEPIHRVEQAPKLRIVYVESGQHSPIRSRFHHFLANRRKLYR